MTATACDSASHPRRFLIVPGYHGSEPAHWQSWMQDRLDQAVRIDGIDWERPCLTRWANRIAQVLASVDEPIGVIAHSFGCLAAVRAMSDYPESVAVALLVAPADPEFFTQDGVRLSSRQPGLSSLLPQGALAVSSLIVASRDDPWMAAEEAERWARRWRAPVINLGYVGHINVRSGFGPWAEGLSLLDHLCRTKPRVSLLQSENGSGLGFRELVTSA